MYIEIKINYFKKGIRGECTPEDNPPMTGRMFILASFFIASSQ